MFIRQNISYKQRIFHKQRKLFITMIMLCRQISVRKNCVLQKFYSQVKDERRDGGGDKRTDPLIVRNIIGLFPRLSLPQSAIAFCHLWSNLHLPNPYMSLVRFCMSQLFKTFKY